MIHATKNSIRSEKIVQAAGRLFATQGYHGTSTRQIAHLAGVSENTLFRHFDSKEDLFWFSLRSASQELKLRRDLLDAIARGDSPEVVLPKLVETMTNLVSYKHELFGLIAAAFLELHWKADPYSREHLAPPLSAIRRYLEINVRNGKLRPVDPGVLTAALVMTTLTHGGIARIIDGDQPVLAARPEAARSYSRFWLELLAPGAPPHPWPNLSLEGKQSG